MIKFTKPGAWTLADLCILFSEYAYTVTGSNTFTRLQECYRQVEAEVVINSRNKLHQTTYKYYLRGPVILLHIPTQRSYFRSTQPIISGRGSVPAVRRQPSPLRLPRRLARPHQQRPRSRQRRRHRDHPRPTGKSTMAHYSYQTDVTRVSTGRESLQTTIHRDTPRGLWHHLGVP